MQTRKNKFIVIHIALSFCIAVILFVTLINSKANEEKCSRHLVTESTEVFNMINFKFSEIMTEIN